MKIIKAHEVVVKLDANVLKVIDYINSHHEEIDFGTFIHPETYLKVIKLKYQTTPASDRYVYEAHRLVDDIHYIKKGSEYISVVKVDSATSVEPYNKELDYELFSSNEAYFSQISEGEIAVFNKNELHLTGFHTEINEVVKYVIKKFS